MPDHVLTQAGYATNAARPLTTEEVRRARMTVASASRSRADCRMLLDILGLMPVAAEERKAS